MSEEQRVENLLSVDVAGQVQLLDVPAALKHIVEALIFASDEPLDIKTIRQLIDDFNKNAEPANRLETNSDLIRVAIEELNQEFDAAQKPYRIVALAGGFAFATGKEYASWIGRLLKEKARRRLSQTAVETLAIVAYKQPITKTEIEFIRGVNSDYIMKALLEKNLVTIVGRASTPGRPLLYGTTAEFLKHFGLNEISDLPKPREIEELISETELEVEKRLLAQQQEIEFKEELEGKLEGHEGTKQKPQKKLKQPKIERDEPPHVQEVSAQPTAEVSESTPAALQQMETSDEPVQQNFEIENAPSAIDTIEQTNETDSAAIESVVHEEPKSESATIETQETMPVQERSVELGSDGEASETEAHEAEAQPESITPHEEHVLEFAEEQKKGWSKWKTKIQTFFRKLFG